MLLLNFAHPLTEPQLDAIRKIITPSEITVINVPTRAELQKPFAPQTVTLVDAIGLTPHQWQSEAILINLPSLNFLAATLLAELHGCMGYFPPAIRLRLIKGSSPPRFEVAEIMMLQSLRDEARRRRT